MKKHWLEIDKLYDCTLDDFNSVMGKRAGLSVVDLIAIIQTEIYLLERHYAKLVDERDKKLDVSLVTTVQETIRNKKEKLERYMNFANKG